MRKIAFTIVCLIALSSCYKCVTCFKGYGICLGCASTSHTDTVKFCVPYRTADSIRSVYSTYGITCDTLQLNYYLGYIKECETKVVKQYERDGYFCN